METKTMDGILNILKPPGMTSFDVVAHLRGVLKTKKIGHTGTLDPGAVGVLPICVGSATKAIEYMTEKNKLYRAELTLGRNTNTQDSSGTTTEIFDVNVTEQQIIDVAKSFVGKYSQVPPMYSAVKIQGKKLYELARAGIEVERTPREVEILSINIIDIKENNRVLFDVHCSKGTYIRTLCEDIGTRLGCGGHMSFLVRLQSGEFDISSALTLEDIDNLVSSKKISEAFFGVERVFSYLPKVNLNATTSKKFLNGAFVRYSNDNLNTGSVVRVYNENNEFFALGEIISRDGSIFIKSKKLFL